MSSVNSNFHIINRFPYCCFETNQFLFRSILLTFFHSLWRTLPQFMFGHIYARSGRYQTFFIFAVCENSIIEVFMCDGTVIDGLCISIADIRGFIEPVTLLFYKVRTVLIAGRTGSTLDVAEHDFFACIRFFAMIPMNTKVMGIQKRTFMIPVTYPMKFYFL